MIWFRSSWSIWSTLLGQFLHQFYLLNSLFSVIFNFICAFWIPRAPRKVCKTLMLLHKGKIFKLQPHGPLSPVAPVQGVAVNERWQRCAQRLGKGRKQEWVERAPFLEITCHSSPGRGWLWCCISQLWLRSRGTPRSVSRLTVRMLKARIPPPRKSVALTETWRIWATAITLFD